MLDFFAGERPWQEPLAEGAIVLRRYAVDKASQLLQQIEQIAQLRPFRHRYTPKGYRMSVAMTECGRYAKTRRQAERCDRIDPHVAVDLSKLPRLFSHCAAAWANDAGYADFVADSCLINRYRPGNRLTLHQDKDEKDLRQPIVSVSLGIPAVFQFGGYQRSDLTRQIVLEHGDVVVWGGVARLCYHGILPVKPASHFLTGAVRYNLTFRRAE